jgi:hypothetical protein
MSLFRGRGPFAVCSLQARGRVGSMQTNVTMKDVADKAGVSKAAVSMVLNRNERISGPTRDKILKAIEELGYQRNEWARRLASFRGAGKS